MYKDLEEVQQLRRPKSKTFKNADGSNKLVLTQSFQHYTDGNGQQQDIDLTPCEDEEGVCTYVEKAPYRAEVSKDKPKVTYYSRQYGDATAELISIDNIPQSEFNIQRKVEGSKVIFEEIIPGVDVYCKFKTTGVEWFKVIKGPDSGFKFEWEQSKTKQANCKFAEKTKGWDKRRKRLDIQSNREENKKDPNRETTTYTENINHKAQKIVDKETRKKEFSEDPEYPLLVDVSIEEQITDGSYDAYFSVSEGAYNTKIDNNVILVGYFINLDLLFYGVNIFSNVPIPKNSVINSAAFKHYLTSFGGEQDVQLAVIDNANAQMFPISTTFEQRVTYNLNSIVNINNSGQTFTWGATGLVQRIINKSGWVSQNNIGFVQNPEILTTGQATTYVTANFLAANEGSSNAGAMLEIDYTPPEEKSANTNIIFTLEALSQLAQTQNLDSSTDLNIVAQNLQNILELISGTDTIQILLQDNTTIEVSLEQTETLLLTLNILQNLYKEFEDTDTLTLTLLTAVANFADTTSSSNITLTLESVEDLLNIFSSTTQIELQTQEDTNTKAQLADTTNLLLQTTEATNILSLIQKQDNLITIINTTTSSFLESTSTTNLTLTLEEAASLLSLLAESDNILIKIEKDENFNKFNFTWTDIDDSSNQEWREVRTNDIIED